MGADGDGDGDELASDRTTPSDPLALLRRMPGATLTHLRAIAFVGDDGVLQTESGEVEIGVARDGEAWIAQVRVWWDDQAALTTIDEPLEPDALEDGTGFVVREVHEGRYAITKRIEGVDIARDARGKSVGVRLRFELYPPVCMVWRDKGVAFDHPKRWPPARAVDTEAL